MRTTVQWGGVTAAALALMSLAAVAGGCSPMSTPSESTTGRPLTESEAMDRIAALPEYERWAEAVRTNSGGKVHPVFLVEERPAGNGGPEGSSCWEFRLGESHEDRLVTWQYMVVDARSGKVSVMDLVDGQYVPLDQWRRGERAK